MKRILLLALLWLVPAQAFHYARMQSLQLLLRPNCIPATINTNRSLLNMHASSVRIMPSARHVPNPTAQNVSWFSRFQTAWNSFFKQPNQPKTANRFTHNNFIKSSAAFSVGAGIGLYNVYNTEACYAAETRPFNPDDLKDPEKLRKVIYSTPHRKRPAYATQIVRYLASYLDGFIWESLLSGRIKQHKESALIIVQFLIQYPAEIAQQGPECVEVVKFLMKHDKALSDPIINCVIKNKSALKKTAYGRDIIAVINDHLADNANTKGKAVRS